MKRLKEQHLFEMEIFGNIIVCHLNGSVYLLKVLFYYFIMFPGLPL